MWKGMWNVVKSGDATGTSQHTEEVHDDIDHELCQFLLDSSCASAVEKPSVK